MVHDILIKNVPVIRNVPLHFLVHWYIFGKCNGTFFGTQQNTSDKLLCTKTLLTILL